MSSGSFFAAGGGFCSGLAGSFVACAHAGVVPAPRANTKATRSAIRRVMTLLLGTSLCRLNAATVSKVGQGGDDLPPASGPLEAVGALSRARRGGRERGQA